MYQNHYIRMGFLFSEEYLGVSEDLVQTEDYRFDLEVLIILHHWIL